jgi:hypothetical protein
MSKFLSALVSECESLAPHPELPKYRKSKNKIERGTTQDRRIKHVVEELDGLRKLEACFLNGRQISYSLRNIPETVVLTLEPTLEQYIQIMFKTSSAPVPVLTLSTSDSLLNNSFFHYTSDLLAELAKLLAPYIGSLGKLDLNLYSQKTQEVLGL